MEIKDKICVVTGAGNGLGRQITLDLVKMGAKVHAVDINEEALRNLSGMNEASIIPHQSDVGDETSVKTLFEEIKDSDGRIDILVNNAGITRDGLLIKLKNDELKTMPLSDFETVLKVNLTGTFLCAREAASLMALGDGGVIINISSVCRKGNFGQSNYSASKAAVDALTVTWGKELTKYKIRCAAIAPGYIATEMVKAVNPAVLEKIVAQIPVKRLGEPNEISRTVQFIVENDFINGKVLEIDGGLRV